MMQSGLSEKIKILRVEADSVVDGAAFIRPHATKCVSKALPDAIFSLSLYNRTKAALGSGLICFCIDSSGAEDYSESGYCAGRLSRSRPIQLNVGVRLWKYKYTIILFFLSAGLV